MYAFVENENGVEVYCNPACEIEGTQWAKRIYIQNIKKLDPIIRSGWGCSSKKLYEILEEELADEVKNLIKIVVVEP